MNVTVRCFAEWRTAEQLPKIIMQKIQRRENGRKKSGQEPEREESRTGRRAR